MEPFLLIVVMIIMVYGLLMIIGGSRAANGFARGLGRMIRGLVRFVGQSVGQAVTAYPVFVGAVVIVITAYLLWGR